MFKSYFWKMGDEDQGLAKTFEQNNFVGFLLLGQNTK